jgi:hypothetical protein
LTVDVDVEPRPWDGTGTVVETGDTWARLDAPAHPVPGERFVGLANGVSAGSDGGVLDGGLPHYDGGGLLFGRGDRVVVAGSDVGTANGRDVDWNDVEVLANGTPVTGIALFCARDSFGVKLVGEAVDLTVGDAVTVTVVDHSSP